MRTLLKSATIIDPLSPYHYQKKDILIQDGIIKEIKNTIATTPNDILVKLENLHISCGWFDTSVCFGEPGFEERETLANGLQVAAKSGFTAVGVNANTHPIIDNQAGVTFLINKAKEFATHLYPIASLTQNGEGLEIAELFDMQQAGAIAFGDYNHPIGNTNLLKIALQYVQNFDGLILSFPKDNAIANGGVANENYNSVKLGLKSIPELAEHLQIARDLFLLEYTGGKLHIPTISTEKSVALVKEAKTKGLDVSCSVSIHHLFLTDDELEDFNPNTKVTPPLRTKKDNAALLEGIKNGTIDMITSDHNPIDIEHKKMAFSKAKNGTIGLESAFGAVNTALDIGDTIKCFTVNPKVRFGLKNNVIKERATAEITLFNPDFEYVFNKQHILSTSKNSIFIGKSLKGKAYGIYANHQLIIN